MLRVDQTRSPRGIVIATALVCAAWYLLMPWRPGIGMGLDYAWALALNVAHIQNRQYGVDLFFTYGCWGFVEQGAYHPATRSLVLILSFMLILLWSVSMWLAVGHHVARNLWLRGGALAGTVVLALALNPWYSLVSVTSMAIVFWLGASPVRLRTMRNRSSSRMIEQHARREMLGWAGVLIFAGIASHMKLTYNVMLAGAIGAALLATLAIARDRWRFALAATGLYLLAWLGAWVFMGQSVSHIPAYLVGMKHLIGSYGDTMAFPGPLWQSLEILGVSLAVAGAGAWLVRRTCHHRSGAILRTLGVLGIAFILFKSGVVRQGDGHFTLVAGALMGVMLITSGAIVARHRAGWKVALPVVLVLLALPMTMAWVHGNSPRAIVRRVINPDKMQAMVQCVTQADAPMKRLWRKQVIEAKKNMPFGDPVIPTDIYPTRLDWPIWLEMQTAFRPTLQSYIAADRWLLQKNADHLRSQDAPQRILLIHEKPMDDHYPALADSLSWPVLWTHYDVVRSSDQHVELRRRPSPRQVQFVPLKQPGVPTQMTMGQALDVPPVPADAKGLWVKIDLKPTFWGQLNGWFYKRPVILMEVTYRNGRSGQFRLIPPMARAGFMLSPIMGFGPQWATFATTGPGSEPDPWEVTQLRIHPFQPSVVTHAYQQTIDIHFQAIMLQPQQAGP